jgi:nucleotide-binding universal stress UspA family protein
MKNATILLIINDETSDQTIEEVAQAVAVDNMHLSCMLLSAGVAISPFAFGAPPYGTIDISDNWMQMVEKARADQNDRVEQIEGILSRTGVSGDVQSLLCSTSEISDFVARSARVCDIALLAPNLRDTPQFLSEAAYGVLFKSPAGLMMNGVPAMNARRILVAWDSSHAASTAVRIGMPYLKAADEVIIACFDPVNTQDRNGADPGTDLAAWLSHHGCKVSLSQFPSGGREIGQCIQDRAKEVGAELVVLGAYGHSRLVQAVFGGTTKTMLEQTDLPVLVAH